MRIYLDTEFHEDGRTIDLISIGLVAEDGRELYLVNRECDMRTIAAHPWLRENVVPHLPISWAVGGGGTPDRWVWDRAHADHGALAARAEIADAVLDFIRATPSPELWAWFSAFDHVALAWLFGPMSVLPDGIPMWTGDLRQEQRRLGDPELPAQQTGAHHALHDARHNQVIDQALQDYVASGRIIHRGQIYRSCETWAGQRIRIRVIDVGPTHVRVVDADTGQRPRSLSRKRLHADSASPRTGERRRSGYVLETGR